MLQLGALAARWRCPMPAALSLVPPTSSKCRQSSDLELLAVQQMRQSQAPLLCTHHTASFASGAVQLALPTATLAPLSSPRSLLGQGCVLIAPCPTAGPALASPKRAAGFGSQQLGHACFSSRAAPKALSWFAFWTSTTTRACDSSASKNRSAHWPPNLRSPWRRFIALPPNHVVHILSRAARRSR